MSNMIKAMVQQRLAALRTSKDALERGIESQKTEVVEGEIRLSTVNAQIIECEEFLAQEDNGSRGE